MRAILTYHSIDASDSVISISPQVFQEHVRWLSQPDVHVLSLDQLLALDAQGPTHAVALTFDDGFANFTEAAKLLGESGLPATLFVVTGHVGGTNAWGGRTDPGVPTLPLLGWPELEQLVAAGVAVGAHTRTHAKLPTLPSAAVADEMDTCTDQLRARLGVRVSHLAYPYGAVDDRVAALAAPRFDASVTARFAPLTPHEPRMWIPRLDMHYFRRPGAIEMWGTPRFARRVWAVRTRRRVREALT